MLAIRDSVPIWRGANGVFADIVEAAAEETVRLIRAEGGNAVYSHCDVSIEDNAWSTVELAITEFGRLDGAFNNARLPPVNVPLHQLTSADFQRSLDINVLGVFHCMKHQIAAMLKAGSRSEENTSELQSLMRISYGIFCLHKKNKI